MTVSQNGNIYLSTPKDPKGGPGGIIAVHLDAKHHADKVERFGTVDGGTAIRFHNGALYAASPSGIYRFAFSGQELVPSAEPQRIIDGMPTDYNRPRARSTPGKTHEREVGISPMCPRLSAQEYGVPGNLNVEH